MGGERVGTDDLMAEYHGTFLKCFNDQFGVVVMVHVGNVRSITYQTGYRALVWLREPVPVGLNETVGVLNLYYEYRKSAGMTLEALTAVPKVALADSE